MATDLATVAVVLVFCLGVVPVMVYLSAYCGARGLFRARLANTADVVRKMDDLRGV